MNDLLLELSKNPQAKKIVQSLGLPIPMPQPLKRLRGPWPERVLDDQHLAVFSSKELGPIFADTLLEAGAYAHLEAASPAFAAAAEAFGRPVQLLSGDDERRFQGVVFDATALSKVSHLDQLHRFFQPLLSRLARCAKVVVVGRPPLAQGDAEHGAVQAALDGFVRSLAKEMGKKGGTVQLLEVEQGAEDRLAGPLRFSLSPLSAYVSGQPIRVTTEARKLSHKIVWDSCLEGKVALVTGAARGIGAQTARNLAAQGAKVVCLDRPADSDTVSALCREVGGGLILCDVTEDSAPDQIAEYLTKEYQGVDIVVHNAGITRDKTLKRMSLEHWQQVMEVNLKAIVRIHQRLEKGVLRDFGRVVCLSSIAGIAGNMGQTNYGASKAAVIGLVELLAEQLSGRGITVNAIAPGFIETRLTARIPLAIREVGRRLNNLGQGGLPEDVAQAITFLTTPAAQGVTGQVLRVCGGSLVGA